MELDSHVALARLSFLVVLIPSDLAVPAEEHRVSNIGLHRDNGKEN